MIRKSEGGEKRRHSISKAKNNGKSLTAFFSQKIHFSFRELGFSIDILEH